MSNTRLWQILVPTISNDGKPFKTRYHRVWDQKVRDIAGGLTITPPTKGQWVSYEPGTEGQVFEERMIPVQIACTEFQIVQIAKMTKEYYNQLRVMVVELSKDVMFI